MESSPEVLLDASILIHAANGASVVHETARKIRDQAVKGEMRACITPQVLWEFYSVITNPNRVNRPLEPASALKEIQSYTDADLLTLLVPEHSTTMRLLALLRRYPVSGMRVFDLFLAATMLDYGVPKIYTENVQDFQIIEGIETINPLTHSSSTM
jgi:predicted nucleic acid-binding protein